LSTVLHPYTYTLHVEQWLNPKTCTMSYYHPLHLLPLPPQIRDPKPYPTAITIDPYTDLLWLGQSSGLTTALYSPLTLTRNVQFPSHSIPSLNTLYPIPSPVKEIKVTDREIWTLTESGICGRKRGGMAKWSVGDVGRGLMSMCGNPVNSHEVLGAGVGGLVVANTSRGEVVRRVSVETVMYPRCGGC
jgi:PAB-dependent poly(A)-specific ribonuclease subunit 2